MDAHASQLEVVNKTLLGVHTSDAETRARLSGLGDSLLAESQKIATGLTEAETKIEGVLSRVDQILGELRGADAELARSLSAADAALAQQLKA